MLIERSILVILMSPLILFLFLLFLFSCFLSHFITYHSTLFAFFGVEFIWLMPFLAEWPLLLPRSLTSFHQFHCAHALARVDYLSFNLSARTGILVQAGDTYSRAVFWVLKKTVQSAGESFVSFKFCSTLHVYQVKSSLYYFFQDLIHE